MVKLKDALQERGLIDRWGFVGFAFVGSVLIWLIKQTTDWPVEAIAFGAVALMATYAVIVSSRGTGKLRGDQAGDNCYYLGLIYTLTSLSHAIFTFDPANTATTIVQGFGIALATTIFGLILRVYFNQSRADLSEIEDTARLELAEAAGILKKQLAQISEEFGYFAIGIQQTLGEVQTSAANSISAAAEGSVAAIRELAASAGEGIGTQSDALKDQVGQLTKATSRTVAALEKHADSLAELTEMQEGSAQSLKVIESAVAAAATGGERMREHLDAAANSQAIITAAASDFSSTVSRLQATVTDSVGSLDRVQTGFENRLVQLEKAPQGLTDAALKAVSGAADRLTVAINAIAERHEAAGRSIEDMSSTLVRSLASHNEEIAKHLNQSAENAGKFGSHLTDAANDLASHVEKISRQ